jgi:hypothetical protein
MKSQEGLFERSQPPQGEAINREELISFPLPV